MLEVGRYARMMAASVLFTAPPAPAHTCVANDAASVNDPVFAVMVIEEDDSTTRE